MTFMQKFMNLISINQTENNMELIRKDLFKIYNGTLQKRREEIISRDLLSTIGLCSSSDICLEARKYLRQSPTRSELCVYSANLCSPSINNNELYLVSHALQWAGAKYRKDAIKHTIDYISAGAISDYIQSYILQGNGYSFDQRIKFIAIEHQNLATLYSKEYKFEDAIAELQKALQIAPYLLNTYPAIAQNYVKLGDYDSALSTLYSAKKTKYYKVNADMKTIIDTSIANTIKKRESGYIYKPRKCI